MNKISPFLAVVLTASTHFAIAAPEGKALLSVDTGSTITKVRTARAGEKSLVVASTYEGGILSMNDCGEIAWEKELSGLVNHDVFCADINGDGIDEILAANGDGSIYCLNSKGEIQWTFKENDAPMYSVCVISKAGVPYVVCGGFDKNLYYLDASGKKVKAIASITYSQEKPWQWADLVSPKEREHTANFIRPIKQKDGTEILAVIGQIAQTSTGSLYLFQPLEEKPFKISKIESRRPIGSFTTTDTDGDGTEEVLLGTADSLSGVSFVSIDISNGEQKQTMLSSLRKQIEGFGYRVAQPEVIAKGNSWEYFVLYGSRIVLAGPDADMKKAEVLTSRYSFNDMCKDPVSGKIILASAQSGGSCVHIIDPANPEWKNSYENLAPPGKIQSILDNTARVREELAGFKKPSHERDPLPVWLMSDGFPTEHSEKVASDIIANYKSPVFLGGRHQGRVESFDRSSMESERYRERRDKRKRYDLTQQEVLDTIIPEYQGVPGIAYWGGHGNDPNYYQVSTTKKIIDAANGKKTVLIFPEIQDQTDSFPWLMNYLIYPLAEYGESRNTNLYIRSKNTFWHGDVYLPGWSRLIAGEFPHVFVPAMEESHSKTMDVSVGARMGIWASGAVDSWGARCARDNASWDKTREHSHQMLPNHFLRHMIYNVSSGAQYLDNFPVDQDYMSLLWELIAKGALYVPKREELVSINPVHLSMKSPDEHFLNEGGNAHWTVFFDAKSEEENKMVFSRMNGSWKGARITEWDFSRYASGVGERRLNYLPPYPHGTVLITPPQEGVFSDPKAPRGKLTDHLHPLYKSITKEYITDGRNYYSADGTETFAAEEYYRVIAADIEKGAEKLPLTVSGENVAWVVAQTAPKHLRLTLVDGGYINPGDRKAKVQFGSVVPKLMTELMSGESFRADDPKSVEIEIPCGSFRFIDIELETELK
ncbi:hypothetical protein ACFSSA_08225 [Luteolibacter algae]|uniref:Lambda-carrageenase n=1 Tax=Luteolibacter algae TaxID=454151 RepID=A0ABW5D8F1_9BACT